MNNEHVEGFKQRKTEKKVKQQRMGKKEKEEVWSDLGNKANRGRTDEMAGPSERQRERRNRK